MQLQKDLGILRAGGYGLGAVSYDEPAVLKNFAARRGIGYPLLSDPGSDVIREFGVADRRYHRSDQLDIERETVYNGDAGFVPVYGLAYPSVFVIGRDEKVSWRFVSENAEFRLTGAAILAHSIGAITETMPTAVKTGRFSVKSSAGNSSVSLGNQIFLNVELTLPTQMHVYGQQAEPEYRGLEWRMNDSHHCWAADDATVPQPEWKRFPFAAKPLPVYEGTVKLQRELTVPPAIDPRDPSVYRRFRSVCLDAESRLRIAGILKVQACDESRCYPPESVPLVWNIPFVAPDQERVPVSLRREHAGTNPQ